METFSALLAICAGNSPVTGEFFAQRPVTRSFHVFFDLRLNKPLSKQSWGWWFETLSRPSWRHRNAAKRFYQLLLSITSLRINNVFNFSTKFHCDSYDALIIVLSINKISFKGCPVSTCYNSVYANKSTDRTFSLLIHWPLGDVAIIFEMLFSNSSLTTRCEIDLRCKSLDLTDENSIFCSGTGLGSQGFQHPCLNQCWPRPMSPCGVTMPQ